MLYENGAWSVGITGSITGGVPTGGGEKQNFTIEFTAQNSDTWWSEFTFIDGKRKYMLMTLFIWKPPKD
ncbi:hypothetical protein [Treponema sp. R6D11]